MFWSKSEFLGKCDFFWGNVNLGENVNFGENMNFWGKCEFFGKM